MVKSQSKEDGAPVTPAGLFGKAKECKVLSADCERFNKCFAPLISTGLPDQWEPFAEWLPRVARFSFAGAKIGE